MILEENIKKWRISLQRLSRQFMQDEIKPTWSFIDVNIGKLSKL